MKITKTTRIELQGTLRIVNAKTSVNSEAQRDAESLALLTGVDYDNYGRQTEKLTRFASGGGDSHYATVIVT